MDTEVADWARHYKPRRIPADEWDGDLATFVRSAILEMDCSSIGVARTLARALAYLAHWGVQQGIPLDVEKMLDPDTVERYCAHVIADDPSAGDYRSTLRRLGRVLTTEAPWEPPPEPLKRRTVAHPYTPSQVALYRQASGEQKTLLRERGFRSALALGLGAGLDGRWMGHVHGTDVREIDRVTLISVGDPAPRDVPVLAEWEEEVHELAELADQELLVGGQPAKNRLSQRINQLDLARNSPPLSPSRLRSTWLVEHLARGTRVPELADAAGVQGLTTLSDLLPDVPRLGAGDARQMLRGRDE